MVFIVEEKRAEPFDGDGAIRKLPPLKMFKPFNRCALFKLSAYISHSAFSNLLLTRLRITQLRKRGRSH
jgi:hypothetical protein